MKIAKTVGILGIAVAGFSLASCGAGGENQGLEFAPQMYHSVAYEPLTQITDFETKGDLISTREDGKGEYFNSNINNPHNMNMREPVANTVPRDKNGYLPYRYKAFEVEESASTKNPIKLDDAVLTEGKRLFQLYCTPCHGAGGEGDGTVGNIIGGVANLKGGAYLGLSEGHIYHVVMKGKGRMGAHGSQITPENIWKIVHYVKQDLQGGQNADTAVAEVSDQDVTQVETPAN
ncbi:cbb3-type cytochrome c oxidase subunit III [Algoriphagus ratkowskyi]|uniref:Cytochrome c n=1 Tax=Algoriphagus ratkowskyi TaxID=57028 RepID=A0A2W7R774_9BACT|nr:cytochrome c [Algoriphagus ratkowskyi]PZX56001.1 cbb3-type cytochrome c oxidase subunit III [Algoriphagus ratkowskyi]TXD77187.1 cytochrome c [Algoriphagus ratkowskyi]